MTLLQACTDGRGMKFTVSKSLLNVPHAKSQDQ